MCTKVVEAVKNDVGEIVEIKGSLSINVCIFQNDFLEKIIQVEVRNESEEVFNSLKNKKVREYLLIVCILMLL